eukprot:COSAG02_NODE_43391_length_375_cov_0.836957_1_plen_35_part_10
MIESRVLLLEQLLLRRRLVLLQGQPMYCRANAPQA